jgi:hypothetical protein
MHIFHRFCLLPKNSNADVALRFDVVSFSYLFTTPSLSSLTRYLASLCYVGHLSTILMLKTVLPAASQDSNNFTLFHVTNEPNLMDQ